MLSMAGYKNFEIAEQIGWSEGKVSVTLRDLRAELDRNAFGASIADRVTDVTLKLQLATPAAVDTAIEIMRNGVKDETRLRAAFGLLDRGGYSPAAVITQAAPGPEFGDEMADALAETFDQMKEHSRRYHTPDAELAIDADFEIIDDE